MSPPGNSAAPGGDTGGQKFAAGDGFEVMLPDGYDRTAYRRRRRASGLIARAATPPPLYGSTEYLALPKDDPRALASMAVAAECWAFQADNLVRDLQLELRLAWEANKRQEDAEYQARARQHAEDWRHLARSPRPYAGQQIPPRPLEDIGREHQQQRREAS